MSSTTALTSPIRSQVETIKAFIAANRPARPIAFAVRPEGVETFPALLPSSLPTFVATGHRPATVLSQLADMIDRDAWCTPASQTSPEPTAVPTVQLPPAPTAVRADRTAVAAEAMLQALGILLLALFTPPTTDPVAIADADFGSESAMSTGQTLPAPTAVWQSTPTISPSQASSLPAPTAVWMSMPIIPSSPAPAVMCAVLLSPTPTVVHAMPPPPALTAMWQPVRTNTNAVTAVAVATDAMSTFTVTNNCGRIKHQMDDAWGLLHSHLIISPKASFLFPGQLAVHANDAAGQSMIPQTDCAGNSQLRHMSARRGWTPGIMFTGLLSPFTLLTVREQLTRLYRFPTLAR